jgi:hypothetical protein
MHHEAKFPGSKLLSFACLVSLSLSYAREYGELYMPYWQIFLPLLLFFAWQIVKGVIGITTIEVKSASENAILNLKMEIIGNLSWLIFSIDMSCFLLVYSEYLESGKHRESMFLLMLTGIVIFLIYSWLTEPSNNSSNILTTVSNMIFSVLGNTMIVCSGGQCTSLYVSTVTAFFSAFGISIVDLLPYINFLAYVLILVSLLSLYS